LTRYLVAFRRDIRQHSSRRCLKSHRRLLMFLGRQRFWRRDPRISDRIFIKSGSPSTMWHSLVTIDRATSEIRRRKGKKRCKRQQPNIMAGYVSIAAGWPQRKPKQNLKPIFHYADFPMTSATNGGVGVKGTSRVCCGLVADVTGKST